MDISGLDKAAVLAALFNASKPQGLSFIDYDAKAMTVDEARELLEGGPNFDYLKGRVMKIDLVGDDLATGLYDLDNGSGAAARVITELRRTGETNSASIQATHESATQLSAKETRDQLAHDLAHGNGGLIKDDAGEPQFHGVATFRVGIGDMAEKLGPAIDKATKK